jgi:ATP-dependent RNA helicase DDX3X
VEVGGDRIPRAIEDFEHAEFPKQLAKNVERVGYKLPTPIQKHCVPFACDMRDVMACAQTGSGKTAAFLLPIVHCMMLRGIQEERVEGRRGRTPAPAAVILSPTRELAIQIHGHARKFCYQTGLRPVVIYGGADRRKQIRDLDSGVDLLVATPGRLNDFLESGTLTLEKCMFCVLDEADRMLDMGFMPQIEGIINDMPAKDLRQTLMFSATFPAEIQQLAAEFLKDDYLFISVGRVGAATTLVKQELRYAEQREKLRELLEMLPSLKGLKLVFVETRREADTVEHQLVRNSIDAISIHGDRSQYEREHALAMFKSGKTQVLVATDVAARGLDIPDVMYVINYDLPNNIDSYVHRIGRTGRCGNEGTAISFVNESNYPIFKDLLEILTEAKQKVPSWFDTMVERGGGRGRGGRRGGKGGTRYGGRDHRVSTGKGKSERYTHGGRSSGRGGDRGGGGFGDFYERDAW